MRLGGIVIGAVAVVTLAAGCGGSDGSQAVSQPKPSTPRAELVLTAADFPAGMKTEVIPSDKSDDPTDSDSEQVTPAACGKDRWNALGGIAEKDISAVGATDDDRGVMYTEAVIDTVVNIGKVKEVTLGECADMTIHSSSGDMHMKLVALSLPDGLRADQAVEYSTGGGSAGESDKEGVKLDALATVRGMTVAITAISMGSPLDRAAFDRIFVAAVNKVASAK